MTRWASSVRLHRKLRKFGSLKEGKEKKREEGEKRKFAALPLVDMQQAAVFSVGATSRAWLSTTPYPGCELSGNEFAIISCRYYGCADTVLTPHVGTRFQRNGCGQLHMAVEEHGVAPSNANIGGDRWRLRHDDVLKAEGDHAGVSAGVTGGEG